MKTFTLSQYGVKTLAEIVALRGELRKLGSDLMPMNEDDLVAFALTWLRDDMRRRVEQARKAKGGGA